MRLRQLCPADRRCPGCPRARAGDGLLQSEWEVNFRNGTLRWSEIDRFDDAAKRIEFSQLGGDFDHFSGSWQVVDGEPTVVRFDGQFDMGIPSLAQLIDPIAERTLAENIVQIIAGLFGDAVHITAGPTDHLAMHREHA